MMVAGTAAAVSVAVLNRRGLAPVFVEASPAPRPALALAGVPAAAPIAEPWTPLARRFAHATALAAAGILAIVMIAAGVTYSFNRSSESSSPRAPLAGPSADLRAGAGSVGGFEQSSLMSAPAAGDVAATAFAAAEEQHRWEQLRTYVETSEANKQAAAAAAARPRGAVAGASVAPNNAPRTLNGASGYAVGTTLRARVTIYGCTGPGGGFCGNMSSGIAVFEGAAACSRDLPFGTRFIVHGDPNGRVYECLDRGALAATWVDVYFNNTSEGMAWQSSIGGTIATIQIVN